METYELNNTLSQTEVGAILNCLLSKTKRLIKQGVLSSVEVAGSRYERIPMEDVIQVLKIYFESVCRKKSNIQNSLLNLQRTNANNLELSNDVSKATNYETFGNQGE